MGREIAAARSEAAPGAEGQRASSTQGPASKEDQLGKRKRQEETEADTEESSDSAEDSQSDSSEGDEPDSPKCKQCGGQKEKCSVRKCTNLLPCCQDEADDVQDTEEAERTCSNLDCGRTFCDQHMQRLGACDECDAIVCNHCSRTCYKCVPEVRTCDECLGHVLECPECGEEFLEQEDEFGCSIPGRGNHGVDEFGCPIRFESSDDVDEDDDDIDEGEV